MLWLVNVALIYNCISYFKLSLWRNEELKLSDKCSAVKSNKYLNRNIHTIDLEEDNRNEILIIFINQTKMLWKRHRRDAHSHLDMLTFLPGGPLCPASEGVCFCVWPHGGSTALRTEGRRPGAGVVGGQWSWVRGIQTRRTRTASVRQSRTVQPSDTSSSDPSHLETKNKNYTLNCQISPLRECFLLISTGEKSYFVMYLILWQWERGCGCSPWPGWTVRSGAPGSGTSVETPGIQFVAGRPWRHLLDENTVCLLKLKAF